MSWLAFFHCFFTGLANMHIKDKATIFSVLMEGDTYSVASNVHDLLVKTHPEDLRKIEEIKQLVAGSLDVSRILAAARPVPTR